jgi:hypothetical protein
MWHLWRNVRDMHNILSVTSEVNRAIGTLRSIWENNIQMDLQEFERANGYWMDLAQDRYRWEALVCKEMYFRVP